MTNLKMYRIVSDDDPAVLEPVSEGWLNGYLIDERLLEDVMFRISINENGEIVASVDPDFAEYFSRMNEKLILKEVVEYARTNDLFETTKTNDLFETTKNSGYYDVVIYDFGKLFDQQYANFESLPIFLDLEAKTAINAASTRETT